jgi:hypothetical protein
MLLGGTPVVRWFMRARLLRSVSAKDGGLSGEIDGAHGPWRCTSGRDTAEWFCSDITGTHAAVSSKKVSICLKFLKEISKRST